MDELKERVGRDLERLQPWPDGLDRTLRRVHGRRRARRLAAASVGVVLTAGLVGGLWTGLRHTPQAPEGPVATASGSGTPSPGKPSTGVVRVRLYQLGDGSQRMPTGVMSLGDERTPVCTQDFEWTLPDGTRARGVADPGRGDLPVCRPRKMALRVAGGTPISVAAGSATDLRSTRTVTPLYRGLELVAVEAHWPDGRATFLVPLDVFLAKASPTHVTLACGDADHVRFAPPTGPRILPGGAAFINGNLPGVRSDDVVEQMTEAPGGSQWEGTWQVVRNGSVIAAIKFPSLGGVACRGSGVGGV